jgi:hypothetical protein
MKGKAQRDLSFSWEIHLSHGHPKSKKSKTATTANRLHKPEAAFTLEV